MSLTELHLEQATLEWFAELGYAVMNGVALSPEAVPQLRASNGDVILVERLRAAIERLNPHLSPDTVDDVKKRVLQSETPSLIEENRRLHRFMVEGVPVEVRRPDGQLGGEQVRLVDLDRPDENDWLVVNQLAVVENKNSRRPDVVVFVNGLPLGVIELKSPISQTATVNAAFQQLQTYKGQIPSLFRTNAVLVASDGLKARVGSLTADRERFSPWNTVDGGTFVKSALELQTVIAGVFEKARFLELVRDFTVFSDTGGSLIKLLAGYHQFHAVRRAVERTIEATRPEGSRKAGVIWHTQGSGKSLLMAFYAGRLVKHADMQNPTLVVLTDRNDLDEQLFGTFSECKDLLRQTPQQATSRAHLRTLLDRPSGGVIFTTLQKFALGGATSDEADPAEEGERAHPVLTDRRNVVVIADEAHRSQYGFRAKLERKTGEISYGFAKHMRDALPNASFIGFTGTPIEQDDVNTPAVFGDYIDVYDISRAVGDGATVPIYYESRLARIELDEDEKPNIDAEIDAILDDGADDDEREKTKSRWSRVEALVGAEKRLALVARDLVEHFENRTAAMDGKGMVVCMSRRICVALYDEIVKLRPSWHSDDDGDGAVKVVMTGSASDPLEWQPHIGSRPKPRRELLARRAKDPNDPLKLVLVRDMWLTGFDAPSMHTMYIDKPMKGHGLMQAIARVNRVFRDKPGGLIVDYIGIAQNLKSALGQYSDADQGQTGIDEAEAVAVMLEKYDVVRAMFRPDAPSAAKHATVAATATASGGSAIERPGGFDYRPALLAKATAAERLKVMADAIEWVLAMQQADAAQESTEDGKRRAHRRYADAVAALSKAYALAGASDDGVKIRDEVALFQAIREALTKSQGIGSGRGSAARDLAVQQLVSRAVMSTEIIDVLKAAGIRTPDISVLSEEFLAEVRGMERKNLAIEALRRLLEGQVRAQTRRNVTQAKAFTERLEAAMARYHANAITTAEMVDELIRLAKEMREAQQRGEDTGLSDDEIAFYDALAANESARDLLGEKQLLVIAHELVESIKGNVTVDWQHREAVRARMRVLVKRILRKYGYPPDLQEAAVRNVLEQAEVMSADWADREPESLTR